MRRLGTILSVIVVLAAIIAVQNRLTASKDASWFTERMTFLPKSEEIRRLLPGYETTYANYLWIRTMLYFGNHYLTDRDFPWLIGMVDMVTRLNPRFYPAYEFAALMIPDYCNNPDAARVILERGVAALGAENFKLPFYLGWLYHTHYHDPLRAAQYLSLAARSDKAPPHVVGLAATFYRVAGEKSASEHFLRSMYQTTENPRVREHVLRKLHEQHPLPVPAPGSL